MNETFFSSLAQARVVLEAWRADYNETRPHLGLGNIPPAEYAEKIRLEQDAA